MQTLSTLPVTQLSRPDSAQTDGPAGPIAAIELQPLQAQQLARKIKQQGIELGFAAVGISTIDLADDERYLERWLAAGFHGEMDYMARHGSKRSRPAELQPGTVSVISVRMDYLRPGEDPEAILQDPNRGYISRYALGRDYHKLMRKRLQQLANKIQASINELVPSAAAAEQRVFVDSAPVLEKALARNAGLGWIGKHSNLINQQQGSFFFLGEIYSNLQLPPDQAATEHCGNCTDCITACPSGAIVAPYKVDARRCISYLTIELRTSIPLELRPLIGNRIYGCDDCQLACPWNKFAQLSDEADFSVRHDLDDRTLLELFSWSEAEFLDRTVGMAIRRTGYQGWLRNIAVAMGNAPYCAETINALTNRLPAAEPMLAEHIEWALERQHGKQREIG